MKLRIKKLSEAKNDMVMWAEEHSDGLIALGYGLVAGGIGLLGLVAIDHVYNKGYADCIDRFESEINLASDIWISCACSDDPIDTVQVFKEGETGRFIACIPKGEEEKVSEFFKDWNSTSEEVEEET